MIIFVNTFMVNVNILLYVEILNRLIFDNAYNIIEAIDILSSLLWTPDIVVSSLLFKLFKICKLYEILQ